MLPFSDLQFSAATLIFGLVLAGGMYWLEKRPRQDLKPRLFPTTLVLFLAIMLALGAAVHLLGLFGFTVPKRQP